jgi:hypothetical protein
MRTTLDLPADLLNEAMAVTHSFTKTALIITALQNLVQREKIKGLAGYFGKVDLNIDIAKMRAR